MFINYRVVKISRSVLKYIKAILRPANIEMELQNTFMVSEEVLMIFFSFCLLNLQRKYTKIKKC